MDFNALSSALLTAIAVFSVVLFVGEFWIDRAGR